jgi:hypothetical protein
MIKLLLSGSTNSFHHLGMQEKTNPGNGSFTSVGYFQPYPSDRDPSDQTGS